MFADLFGTEDEQADYLWGLIFAGVFLFVMFILWSIMLLIFKCLGRRRVGPLLSGTAFVKANPNSMCNGPFMTRIVFVMSAIIFIIFSVLFVTEGLTNLKSTVSTFLDTAKVSHSFINQHTHTPFCIYISQHIQSRAYSLTPIDFHSFIRMSTKSLKTSTRLLLIS